MGVYQMKMIRKTVGLCVLATVFSGCGLPGRWETESFKPELARESFVFLGADPQGLGFRRTNITFYHDGRYDAEIYYGMELHRSSGDWERYDGKLTFVDMNGKPYTYDVQTRSFSNEMRLITGIKGTDAILTMRRTSKK
jgi:hypothetical protein